MLEEKDGNLQDPVGKEDEKVDKQTHHEENTSQEDPQSEIDDSNAEDAEDVDNASRHSIPDLDYET